MAAIRVLKRKGCIHHFFGKKMIDKYLYIKNAGP